MFLLWPSRQASALFALVVVFRAQLPNFATRPVVRRLGVRALNLDTAGSHKVVSLGLAMKSVKCALFSVNINMLTMCSS